VGRKIVRAGEMSGGYVRGAMSRVGNVLLDIAYCSQSWSIIRELI